MLAAGFRLPEKNILVSLGGDENKVKLLASVQKLAALKFSLYATEHTAGFLTSHGLACTKVYKMQTRKNPNVARLIEGGELDLIINIPLRVRDASDGFLVRRRAIDLNIPLITNRQLAEAFV